MCYISPDTYVYWEMEWDKDECSRGYGSSLAKVGKDPHVDVLL